MKRLVPALLAVALGAHPPAPRVRSWPSRTLTMETREPGSDRVFKELRWTDGQGRAGAIRVAPPDYDRDGWLRPLQVEAALGAARSAVLPISNIDRNYAFFSVLETRLQRVDLGEWTLWDAAVEPTTNGDPPEGHLFLVEDRKARSLGLGYGVGRGLMGFRREPGRLELFLLGQGGQEGAAELIHWAFTRTPSGLRAEQLPSCFLFMLDGGRAGLLDDDREAAGRKGLAFYARPVRAASPRGGVSGPEARTAGALPFLALPHWQRRQDHYATQYWGDFHWAWDLDWHRGPVRTMVGPAEGEIPFRWAREVHVFRGEDPFDPYGENVGPREAARLAAQPGWGVVLVKDRRVGAAAVGLVPPELLAPAQGGPTP